MPVNVNPDRNAIAEAAYAAEAIQRALAGLGIPASARGEVRPVVRSGTPYVRWGLMRADIAERVAEVLLRHGAD